ncbi:serine/threonine-protein kinase SMG1 [Anopheles sinensis]|uniref:Serine/threonine-protein kinase SMG1 n=1 Tax=Anopheles sinensis TaxID=74873 RepID=A0A084VY36_ANOSI|nr:serine/threonine-protein kinase SMG1 [Anopheles sinensis]
MRPEQEDLRRNCVVPCGAISAVRSSGVMVVRYEQVFHHRQDTCPTGRTTVPKKWTRAARSKIMQINLSSSGDAPVAKANGRNGRIESCLRKRFSKESLHRPNTGRVQGDRR